MRLVKTLAYRGEIELKTGLSIKGMNNDLNIGGVDSEVIKNPITGMPYIPGSSLKVKMRSLLERSENRFNTYEKNGKINYFPCGCGRKECPVCVIYGAHKNTKANSAPTRIIVRDCDLTEESMAIIRELPLESGSFLENKAENIINRSSGTAESPRVMERVPAGLTFNLEIILQIFDEDNEGELKKEVEKSLQLLENNYLGGSGSRGYGQVKINNGKWEETTVK